MAVFNSLGSNYTFSFALMALFVQAKNSYRLQLIKYLEKKYGGEVLLTYKGREALRLALRSADLPKKYAVGICGFTCYAVYEAIVKEGYRVVYVDIADGDLNFSYQGFVESVHKHPSIKALVVQNTLGFPCDMKTIAEYCRERGIILIEDMAHSAGAIYEDKKEAGTVGDFAVLSFSQDKMVDGITGGAVIIKDQRSKIKDQKFAVVNFKQQLKDRFYPLFTWIIRKTYGIGLGKALHLFLRKFNLLSNPMWKSQRDKIFGLPDWYCYLIYRQFTELNEELNHRKRIATIYADGLNKKITSGNLNKVILKASNLRFPIFVLNREGLILFLRKYGIFISDIWFDSPIAPKSYLQLTDYNHDCPNSEKASLEILNLPTHRNVTERDAKYIVEIINKWLKAEGGGN